jgi:hypothetical protein
LYLLSSVFTLYQTRRLQLEQYGYVAYGFTVVPYAVMTLVNLLANLVTPDYPTLYMIRTAAMDEAERLGGKFIGVVASVYEPALAVDDAGQNLGHENDTINAHDAEVAGQFEMTTLAANANPGQNANVDPTHGTERPTSVDISIGDTEQEVDVACSSNSGQSTKIGPSNETESPPSVKSSIGSTEQAQDAADEILPNGRFAGEIQTTCYEDALIVCSGLAFTGALATPYAIMGAFTHFNPGHSTTAQRTWIMLWIVLGQVCGYTAPIVVNTESRESFYPDKHDAREHRSNCCTWGMNRINSGLGWYFVLFYAAPAIGGFVVVGQMIAASGTCGVFG